MTQLDEPTGARRAVDPDDDRTRFRGAVGWTIAGTILPGLGLLKARRWPEGVVTLLLFLGLVVGVGYLTFERAFLDVLTSSPITLTGIALLCGMLALMMTGVIVGTYRSLSPHLLSLGQRRAGGALVAVLVFVVCVPLAVGIGVSLSEAGLLH